MFANCLYLQPLEEFDQILADATEAIAENYFQLPVHGGDPVYRERVYPNSGR